LHGRTYDNQRYSPLKQITADNAKSLSPVALVQTGMTASFETTPVVVNGVDGREVLLQEDVHVGIGRAVAAHDRAKCLYLTKVHTVIALWVDNINA